ncbi:LLM class flavin-dependent oxidoreductase [Flavisphingomonas formosensis]|uniref:LLM class flavin-dependent oxidoreductase n=1 Tax=Flavisphingomonas formosensis TaxID=861534 RepID=UPI0012F9A44D|nr:LLM class flavin-dependent oxidoreductase [Sphingomonas formosensis]
MVALSMLEPVRVTQDTDASQSLENARDLAVQGESWGYRRFWVTEHHNMPSIAGAATAVVLAHVGAGTRTIRIGAGGIMLPNHAPLVIAEQFGTLARLFPGRVDLGLGRAPGTDQATVRALRRPPGADGFPNDVQEVQGYFSAASADWPVQAVPAAGTDVPIWILGSSTYGAQLAAHFGLPFAFASHFAPAHLLAALDIYRATFRPSAVLGAPHAMVGVNIIAADSDAAAQRLATSQQMSYTNLFRGSRTLSHPPIDDIEAYWTPAEKFQVGQMLARSIVGSPETVRAGIAALIAETDADELMIASDVYDHLDRLRSFELIASAMGRQEGPLAA